MSYTAVLQKALCNLQKTSGTCHALIMSDPRILHVHRALLLRLVQQKHHIVIKGKSELVYTFKASLLLLCTAVAHYIQTGGVAR